VSYPQPSLAPVQSNNHENDNGVIEAAASISGNGGIGIAAS
jgi:hypothetical protein